MKNILKKIIASATVLTVSVWLVGPGAAQALTSADLQAQIDALMAQIVALQAQLTVAQGGTSSVAVCSGITFSRNLKQGMSGTDVKCLQGLLNQSVDTRVSASGVGSAGSETLYFGALTKTAVVKFQNKYAAEVLTPLGLTAGTGFVGAKTIVKLNSVLGSTPAPAPVPAPGTPPAPLPTAAGLTVAVASDNPAAASIISDGTQSAAGSQALIPALKLTFSTPAGSSAKITTLKLKRLGISTDTDIPNAYLYDGDTQLTELTSLSSGVLTFSDAAGLFTVSGSKVITVKFDLHKDSSSGKLIGFGLNAAADITTDASVVNGTFPINGNLMTVATVTDYGRIQITTSTNAVTVDPGTNAFEAFRFTMAASNQKVDLYSIKFRQIGSIATGDIANLKLSAGGVQLGSTVASLTSDGYVTFDMSAAPYQIPSGTTKTFSLTLDIVKGSTRTIQFSLSKSAWIVVKDNNYGTYIGPDSGTIGTFSTQDSQSVSVNSGSIVISRRTDSPSGNIALNKTNVVLARFDAKATGENIKLSSLVYRITPGATDWVDIKNSQILIDGVQRGTTQVTVASDTDYTITTNYTFPAGESKIIEVRADIVTVNGGLLADDTIKALLVASTSVLNAERQVSLTSFAFPSADQNGNNLTVSASALSSEKNVSKGNIQAVYSSADQILGSYVVSAGAAEGVDVNKLVFEGSSSTDATSTAADTASLGAAFTNLTLYKGTTKLGSTIVPNTADAAGTDYTFNLSPTLSLAAGESATLDLRGDILASGLTWSNSDDVALLTVEGTGKVTGNTITDSDGAGGQTITLSTSGDIALIKDSSSPIAKIASLGDTGVTLGVWRMSQVNSVEDLVLEQIYVWNGTTSATSSSNVKNLQLFCGSTQFGSTKDSLINTGSTQYYAVFNGSCTIPKGNYKLLTVKGDLTAYSNGAYPTGGPITAGSDQIQLYMELPASISGISSDYVIAKGSGGAYASSTNSSTSASKVYPYRTNLTMSMASGGTATSRARQTSDKIATLTLTGTANADAVFRASLAEPDDDTTNGWAWASNTPVGTDATDWAAPLMGLTLTATTGSSIDGSASIQLTTVGSSAAATSTWMAVSIGDITSYSKLSMWVYPSTNTAGTVFFSDTNAVSSTIDPWASSTASTTLPAVTPETWNFVTVSIPTGLTSYTTWVGLQAWVEAGTEIYFAVDQVRAYNDSITIDITGNTTSTATGTAFTLKTTAGTQVASGYLSSQNIVTLIPDGTGNESILSAGSTPTTYDLFVNTNTLMKPLVELDPAAVVSLGLNIDLGTADSAADVRWYDQGVNVPEPVTWVYGTTPLTVNLTYSQ